MQVIDEIQLGESFHGEGWYEVEGSSDQPIRWMKSGCDASITVIADLQKAVHVECQIVSIICKEVIGNLDVKVDGELIDYTVIPKNKGYLLSFLIGKRSVTPIAKVIFTVKKTFTPEGPDERTISLAFRRITVNHINYENVLTTIGFKVGN